MIRKIVVVDELSLPQGVNEMTNTVPVAMFGVLCGASSTAVALATTLRRAINKKFAFLVVVLALLTLVSVARAQEVAYSASFARNKEPIAVNVLVGQSRLITFDRSLERFSVSNPEI